MTEEEQKKESVEEKKEEKPSEPVDEKELIKRIQVILFASGRAVDVEELSSMTKESSARNIKKAVAELKKQMEERDAPLMIVEEKEDTWKFAIKDTYLTFVTDLIPSMDLDKATLETLAVIAWRNPVLQADVVKIRTSNAYDHIAKLVDMGFVSKERYGRSFVLKPTSKFFEYFDLPSKEYIKKMFKDVADGIRVIDDKKEEQKELSEEPDKVGDMPVYETEPDKPEKETEEEPEIHLGKLEVYGEGGKKLEKTKEKIKFDELEKQEEEEPEEEPEVTNENVSEEDKAMDVINNIAGMEEKPEEEPASEETDGETEDGEESEEKPEEKKEEPEAPPEHDLSPELEEFAGIKKPEEKPAEEYEEDKKESEGEETTDEKPPEEESEEKPKEGDIDNLVEEK